MFFNVFVERKMDFGFSGIQKWAYNIPWLPRGIVRMQT